MTVVCPGSSRLMNSAASMIPPSLPGAVCALALKAGEVRMI